MDSERPRVVLVGAGVVGRAILRAHVEAGLSVCLVDQDAASLDAALRELSLEQASWQVSRGQAVGDLPAVFLSHRESKGPTGSTLLIESIAEKLEVKQRFFAEVESLFDSDTILCSNTSTLKIAEIGRSFVASDRLVGLHFFMPVVNRDVVELVRTDATASTTLDACCKHVVALGKQPLIVRDSPGFVVNRILTPYLNQSMLLLCRGVDAERIEQAALAYGMPMSPLELLDWIGARTVFDAGRVFWQAFPTRLDASPLPAGLIKSGRLGRSVGAGIYDYEGGERVTALPSAVRDLCARYQREIVRYTDHEVSMLLAVPMWMEAALALRDGVVNSAAEIDLAVRGGLGYDREHSWLDYFDGLGSARIVAAIDQFAASDKCLAAPAELRHLLAEKSPSEALREFSGR